MADTQICGPNECLAGKGTDGRPIYAPAGTPFTPGVLMEEGSGTLYGPIQQPEQDIRLPWPVGLLVIVIAAIVLWRLLKAVWARLRSTPT